MGTIIAGECECGYHSKDIYVGESGFSGQAIEHFPFHCEDCDDLVVIDLYSNELTCPKCKGDNLIAYDDERFCTTDSEIYHSVDMSTTFGRKFILRKDNNLCPKCKKFTLNFKGDGLWD